MSQKVAPCSADFGQDLHVLGQPGIRPAGIHLNRGNDEHSRARHRLPDAIDDGPEIGGELVAAEAFEIVVVGAEHDDRDIGLEQLDGFAKHRRLDVEEVGGRGPALPPLVDDRPRPAAGRIDVGGDAQ